MQKTQFENSETLHNLARAYAGECQASVRYNLIAKKAKEENYVYLNYILKKIAKNEIVHAKIFYDAIINNAKSLQNNIEITAGYPFKHGTLLDNLKHSLDHEKSESSIIYPAFAKVAQDEGFHEIAELFNQIAEIESYHHKHLQEIFEQLKNKKIYKSAEKTHWTCSECGYEKTARAALEVCPVCTAPKGCVIIKNHFL